MNEIKIHDVKTQRIIKKESKKNTAEKQKNSAEKKSFKTIE